MKKIECHISDGKSKQIDKICNEEGYTRAEFNRRALELYLAVELEVQQPFLFPVLGTLMGYDCSLISKNEKISESDKTLNGV